MRRSGVQRDAFALSQFARIDRAASCGVSAPRRLLGRRTLLRADRVRPPASRRRSVRFESADAHYTTHATEQYLVSTDTDPDRPTVARLKVHGQDRPSFTDAVAVADKTRIALLSNSDSQPVFAGKDDDGPLSGHRHNHVLVESLDESDEVTHLLLYAPGGFDERAQEAISNTTKVWENDGPVVFDIQTILLGLGQPADFGGPNRRAGHSLALAESKVWRSRTPFVPTRHPKNETGDHGYAVGSPPDDLLRLLDNRGLPTIERIEALEDQDSDTPSPSQTTDVASDPPHPVYGTRLADESVAWDEFRTIRPNDRGQRSSSRGDGFELEFAEPVRGPICAGYGAHFGLGRFEPVHFDDPDD
jgi:CRISPR-associated protein Csb2